MNKNLDLIQKLIDEKKFDQAMQLAESSGLREDVFYSVVGVILAKQKKFTESKELLHKALSLNSDSILANLQLASILVLEKKYALADKYNEVAYKKNPKDLQAISNKTLILLEAQKFNEVISLVEPIINKTDNHLFVCALISALRSTFEVDRAQTLLEAALTKYPKVPDVVRLRADLLAETNPIKAASAFNAIDESGLSNDAVKWNSSFIDLRARNFSRGWENYEYGLKREIGRIGRPLPELIDYLPRVYSISDIDPEKFIVVCGEQGIGDQVFFMSNLPLLFKKYKKIIYICDQRMLPIVRRSFPEISSYSYGFFANFHNHYNVQGYIPVGSLMKDFRKNLDDFTSQITTYLKPDIDKVKKYREVLRSHANGKPVVGISWKGGFWEKAQLTKTIELNSWRSLLTRTDMSFVSLQYGDVSEDRKFCKENGFNVKFITGVDFKAQIDDWFALACAADMIVSISTALVHFAGAAGKKVYVLLGDRQQPFIWGLEETKSIVYPDVHLMRKKKGADTEIFFKQINSIFI